MITLIRKCICVPLMLAASYCAVAQQQKDSTEIDYRTLPDSLITPVAIQRAISDPSDKAQKMLDVMRERKLQPQFYIDYLQGWIYSDQEKYRIGLHHYERALEDAPQTASTRIKLYAAVLINYDMLEDFEKMVHYSEAILKIADETNSKDKPYIAQAFFYLATIQFKLGDNNKAEEYLNKGIQILSGESDAYALIIKSDLCIRGAEWLTQMEQYEQGYHYLQIAESAVTELIRLNMPGYKNSIQRLQGDYVPRMATILHGMGRENEAEQSYRKFLSLDIVNEELYHETDDYIYFTRLIIDYLIRAKKYNEALGILEKHEDYLQARDVEFGEVRQTAYSQLSSVYAGLKDYRAALEYAQKQIAVADSMRIRQKKSDALEMAVIYETHEKEMLIQKTQSDLQQRETELMAAAVGLVLFLSIIILITLNRRKIQKKNRILVKQIKEMQEQWKIQEEEILNKPLPDADENDILCPESRRDKLCNDIRNMMLKERLYRNPSLSRDDLIARLGVSKAMFIEAFQYCFNTTFPIYINSLRLKDAIVFLENSDLSLEEIAEKAGFGTARTFQRQFQKEYGMSPRDYRKTTRE